MSSNSKGNILEETVRAIEEAILRSDPGLQGAEIRIRTKKIVTIDGVRHEIDVWTEILHRNDYNALFIFECKNWDDPVDKNEIIVFSEKIRAVSAQRGFIVARSFTKPAHNQAKLDKRIRLLTVTEHPQLQRLVPCNFHTVVKERWHADVQLNEWGVESKAGPQRKLQVEAERSKIVFNGEQIDFNRYIQNWGQLCSDQDAKKFQSSEKPDGQYERSTSDTRRFRKGEFIVNNMEIESISIVVNYTIRVARPEIVSNLEVDGRGKAMLLRPIECGDGTIQYGFVSSSSSPAQ